MKLFYTLLITLAFTGIYTATAQTKADSAVIAAYMKVKDVKETVSAGPLYEEYYSKLKELNLKMLNSYSHKKFRKLNRIFINKINYKGNLTEISNDFLGYIKTNLVFTSFKSYEEAQQDWEEVILAAKESNAENYEYHAFLLETIKVCGPETPSKVMFELIKEYPDKF